MTSPISNKSGRARGKLRDTVEKAVVVATVKRFGSELILPRGMTARQGAEVLERLQAYENSFVDVSETLRAFPWDGALALYRVMEQRFGAVFLQGIPTMFSAGVAQEIKVPISVDDTINVPWGRIAVPTWPQAESGDVNYIETGVGMDDRGVVSFRLTAHVQRMYQDDVDGIIADVKAEIEANSVFRGKAISLQFADNEGVRLPMPQVQFFRHDDVEAADVIFSDDVQRSIEGNIFSLINHADHARTLGTPLKRGILLTGEYGVGKTLLAAVIAKEATRNGWTFIYLRDVAELTDALGFARQYSRGMTDDKKPRGAIVFAEDIDRVVKQKRTAEVNRILNTLDGIDSKSEDIMVVLTTNHPDRLNKALVRTGRLDAILHITAPDAIAVERLIRSYGRGWVRDDVDLVELGSVLDGQIPATIREVVERSKLFALYRTGSAEFTLSSDDLLLAARDVLRQQELVGKPVLT